MKPNKISTRTQTKFDDAKSKGINIQPIVELYGIRFAVKLLKRVLRTKKNDHESVPPLFPKFKVIEENEKKAFNQYIELLEDCGIKIKYWNEDFVDEDTGENVPFQRIEFYTL